MAMEATARGEARRLRMQEKKRKKKPQNETAAGTKTKKMKFKRAKPLTDADLQRFASDDEGSGGSEGEANITERGLKNNRIGRNGEEASFSEKLWSETKKRSKEDAAAQGLDTTAFESGSEGEDAEGQVRESAEATVAGDVSGSSDEASGEENEEDGTKEGAFARAFSRILDEKIVDDAPGPILAKKAKLLAKKAAEEEAAREARKEARQKKLELKEKCHVLPKTHTDVKEKELLRTATKGVVQLFNAVTKAQKAQAATPWMRGQGGRTAARDAEKQSRAAFLAELRGAATSASTSAAATPPENGVGADAAGAAPPLIPSKGAGNGASGWEVLRDDYMLGRAKLKDWDKAAEHGDGRVKDNNVGVPLHGISDGEGDDDF